VCILITPSRNFSFSSLKYNYKPVHINLFSAFCHCVTCVYICLIAIACICFLQIKNSFIHSFIHSLIQQTNKIKKEQKQNLFWCYQENHISNCVGCVGFLSNICHCLSNFNLPVRSYFDI
jgi:hypothetical protein